MASLSTSLPQDDSGHRVAFKHTGKVILTPHPSLLEDTLFIHVHEDSLGARVWDEPSPLLDDSGSFRANKGESPTDHLHYPASNTKWKGSFKVSAAQTASNHTVSNRGLRNSTIKCFQRMNEIHTTGPVSSLQNLKSISELFSCCSPKQCYTTCDIANVL